ncbi:MAG: CPBP family glutamic-type intramembrane protease, partial [Planctomycetia bacterium]
PDLSLSGPLQVAPLVNIVLLARDLFDGRADAGAAFVVVASTALYAVAALMLAARVFGAESVLYAAQSSWTDLFHRPRELRATASPSSALTVLAVTFPTFFLVSKSLAQAGDWSLGEQLFLAAASNAVVFAGLPLATVFARRLKSRTSLGLERFAFAAWPMALVLGASLQPFSLELVLLGRHLGFDAFAALKTGQGGLLLEAVKTLPAAAVVAAIGFIPGIVEELYFRGFLFSSLLARWKSPAKVVAVTAVAFGAFHVVGAAGFTFERFLPTAFVGLVLGWVRWRTGTVVPGMLLHATFNSIVLILAIIYGPEWGTDLTGAADSETPAHVPATWLLASGTAAVTAAVALHLTTRPKNAAAR